MIYTDIKDGKLQNIIAICDCGCSGFSFKLSDDVVFISAYGSKFYDFQGLGNISFKAFKQKLQKKENVIADIILPENEAIRLTELLKSFEFSKPDKWTYKNVSHIEINPIQVTDEILEYEMLLIYDGNLLSILRNKTFRGFEIALKENEFKTFIRKIEKEMAQPAEKL